MALVTGASKGVGRAVALAMSEAGADVLVNYRRSRAKARAVAAEISALGREGVLVQADISRERDVRRMMGVAKQRFGRLDILVNNAGYVSREVWFAAPEKITPRLWAAVIDTDLRGSFLCCQKALPLLRKSGSASIINVSSTPALTGDVHGLLYSVAKAGILGLTKSLARTLAPRIRVNALALGSIETGWLGWLGAAERRSLRKAIPLRRWGQPEEVAQAAVFLASSASDFITGQTLVVDGGEYMHG